MQLTHDSLVEGRDKALLDQTIKRTIKTAQLLDVFWERWIAHGIEEEDIERVKSEMKTLDDWLHAWQMLATEKEFQASKLEAEGMKTKAELKYRQASLCYNLNYWIFPYRSEEKQFWYKQCLQLMEKADALSEVEVMHDSILFEGIPCPGRIRIPSNPKGCIIIINPIDSSKDELYKYEMEFLDGGFATISFDGPGQGESYVLNGLIGSGSKWESFTFDLIEYVKYKFPELPIYLFGTSLGATWVLLGASHPFVDKAVAVSPAVALDKMNMPNYFQVRMNTSNDLGPHTKTIPDFKQIEYKCPILVFHGKEDMMVPSVEMYDLFANLPEGKKLIEYEKEGHCCNNKLAEIRSISKQWFSESNALG